MLRIAICHPVAEIRQQIATHLGGFDIVQVEDVDALVATTDRDEDAPFDAIIISCCDQKVALRGVQYAGLYSDGHRHHFSGVVVGHACCPEHGAQFASVCVQSGATPLQASEMLLESIFGSTGQP